MDNQLALIGHRFVISWFGLFCAVGCLLGIMMACVIRGTQKKAVRDVFATVTFAVPLALVLARAQYCLFASDHFTDVGQMMRIVNGGYGLFGGMLGVLAAALLVRYAFQPEEWGGLLDGLSLGGALAIAVGRFATGFTGAETGYEVPFSVMTVYDREQDLHVLAVYMLDGFYEAAVLAVCLFYYIFIRVRGNKSACGGLTALLMVALHGTNQVIMDSMRSDALKLGANDFIKISQIAGVVCCVAVAAAFMVKSVKRSRFRLADMAAIAVIAACVGLGVAAEWRVGNGNYISKHILMLACMLVLGAVTFVYGCKAAGVDAALTASKKTDSLTAAGE